MSYQNIYDTKLTPDQQKKFDSWASQFIKKTGRKNGKQIIANIKQEEQMPDSEMESFLKTIISSKKSPDETFEAACDKFKLSGHPARIGKSDDLARAVDSLAVITELSKTYKANLDWKTMTPKKLKRYLDKYNGINVGRKDPVFATLNKALQTSAPAPPDKFSALRVFQLLGLKYNTQANVKDAGAVLFIYASKTPPSPPGVRIPTIADAGTFAEFRPSTAGSSYGMTLDLADPAGKSPGLPEVVHGNFSASQAAVDIIHR